MGIATDHSLPQAGMASAPETSTEHAQRVDLFIFAMVGVAAAVSWARILPRINGIDVLAVTTVRRLSRFSERPWRISSPDE